MAEPLQINYTVSGPVASAFHRSESFVRAIMGPYGSGKSTACIMEILRRAGHMQPGPDGIKHSRWAVIRNTYPELRTTTIRSWHQWVPRNALGTRWVDDGPPTHTISGDGWECEVMFVALDRPQDISKLLSMELTGAWINEAREIPRAVLDGVTGRVGRYPGPALGGCSWSGVIMDTNPPDSDHWYYKLAEEQCPQGWSFFRQPGGLAEGAENLNYLSQTPASLALPLNHPDRLNQGREYYRRMSAGKDPDWIKVYVDSEYGFVKDGKPVWPAYQDTTHCAPFELVRGGPIYVGMDFGIGCSAAAFGQRTLNGQWRIHSELVVEDLGAIRFSAEVNRVIRERYGEYPVGAITGDPAGDSRAGTDEQTPFQIMRANGVQAQPAPTNDPTKRIEAVNYYLGRMSDGKPAFLIHPQCKMLRKGMAGAYQYKRVQVSTEGRYQDKPDKGPYSHICDALQYMLIGAGEGRTIVSRSSNDMVGRAPRQLVAVSDYDFFNT